MLFISIEQWERIFSIISYLSGQSDVLYGGSIEGRFNLWSYGLKMFHDHPIFGVGAGAFPSALQSYTDIPRETFRAAHSMHMQVLAELGFLGICSYLFLIFVCIKPLFMAQRGKENHFWQQRLTFGLLISFIIYLIVGSFLSLLWYNTFWFLIGLIAVSINIELNNDK